MLFPIITIRQPWAWLILQQQRPELRKDIENRNWKIPPKYLNTPVLVHSSVKPDCKIVDVLRDLSLKGYDNTAQGIADVISAGHDKDEIALRGHVVGVVRFSDCIENKNVAANRNLIARNKDESVWADPDSRYWWKIEKAKPVKPEFVKGQLRIWKFAYRYVEELVNF